ncbi:hypothetical protein UFOVP53_149 [uncultured Caudovirales phage]|uniref:Uncharacterized protein n=1 Tax=uncultured Caudovirales phage TaxID=2100421 RepID=A0A6J5KVT7_9CAUD|nr:hypothetical protein UFOVP53_149 [uncultured Caudovirales phage]
MKPPKYESYISDLDGNAYFCPNCHNGTFYEHNSPEYRGWHKCTHCGFMQLTKDHLARIKRIISEYHKVPLDTQDQQTDKDK